MAGLSGAGMLGAPSRESEIEIVFGHRRTHVIHGARHDAVNQQTSFIHVANLFAGENVEPYALREDFQEAFVGASVHLGLDRFATALKAVERKRSLFW
jgi:hypothetical protein